MSLRRLALVSFLCVGAPSAAFAQAWVGDRGDASVGLDYSFVTSDDLVEGENRYPEKIRNHNAVLGLEYVPIDFLALRLDLPFVTSKYAGDGINFQRHGDYDDGDFHSTFTDLAVRARYQLLEDFAGIAFSPHLGFSIPVADYETTGFAGAGRHLKALLVGGSLGRMFDPFLPNAFIHLSYELTLAEKYDEVEGLPDYGQNRSVFNAQIGYFVTPKIEVNLAFDLVEQHDGINFEDVDSDLLLVNHDPILNEDYRQIGAGASWYVSDSFRVAALFRAFLSGNNTRTNKTFGLSLTYEFGIGQDDEDDFADEEAEEAEVTDEVEAAEESAGG